MAYVLFQGSRPYLFDSRWRASWGPSQWLFDLRNQNVSGSPNTQRDYAYIIGDLISWCEEVGKSWSTLTIPEMIDYVDSFDVTNDVRNKRVGVIYDYYLWAQARGRIRSVPFELRKKAHHRERRSSRRRMGQWGKGHEYEPVLIKNRRAFRAPKTITVPSITQAWAFRDSMPTDRYSIMVELFMFTGLRVSEVADLTVHQIMSLAAGEFNRSVMVKIHGKGNKDRLVPFPHSAVLRIQRWISLQKEFARPKVASATRLFAGARGTLSTRAIQKMFKKMSRACGLAIHPHALRHFFAVHYLKYLQDNNDPSPLEQLRQILGHNSIETTQQYLHLTDQERVAVAEDHGSFVAAISSGQSISQLVPGADRVVRSVARYEFQHSLSRR